MKFDVIIVGGGLVGASLALALKDSGLKIALVESRPPVARPGDDSWDSRIYAISPGSAGFLQSLGVWQTLDQARITPVYNMAVFGDDSAARIDFSAYDIGCSELNFIVENGQLQAAAWNRLNHEKKHVKIFCPAQCASITRTESDANLYLDDGRILQAALIVGADGLNSWVREHAGIEVVRHSYQQTGVVANFKAERQHRNVAHQWFRRDGVLALLPLPDAMVSMVWSANEERASALLGLPETELCREVAEASCRALGEMQLVTRPAAFPLNFVHVKKLVQPHLALIGDAAHGIHPLAGQGVNLGLRDAQELAAIVLGRGLQPNCGDYLLLRRYERARKEDILAMELVTDSLQKLFNNTHPTLVRLRNVGLELTNRLPLLKDRLMRHALG
ncbi:UbiH/UbiF family hydroxylase [Nitrosovibrio tenuis]|uniref:2-octaprenyl-3-methyl-6-methoxy-1,4-benzoquinol hydroxylase n=1 Tax=Nitrosovibrio tenuis TaxID=1233 RepID=A0A1H7G9K2_9PROT|nr:UbiH/UbiF family hydroxylase [Nitrosovibrio tenuis]SEK34157.1 2-octaprenyl-3-methyl-6-methoxy-1,4-benzoquinol hydroxylase [Nitrosovibrio tenuis]